jgi:hypothetical protein
MDSERDYLLRRAEQESRLARDAGHKRAASAHSQLASLYRERAERSDEGDGGLPA